MFLGCDDPAKQQAFDNFLSETLERNSQLRRVILHMAILTSELYESAHWLEARLSMQEYLVFNLDTGTFLQAKEHMKSSQLEKRGLEFYRSLSRRRCPGTVLPMTRKIGLLRIGFTLPTAAQWEA